MLENLHIKNVALIEEAEIEFGEGLNILSGETGAGKSMIIDSLNFALGERFHRDFLRNGQEQACVEALFYAENPELESFMLEGGIPLEKDSSVLIKRTLSASGKTVNRVNGATVTVGMLRQLSQYLIDMHGQHEHQSLLESSKHIRLLDQFCGIVLTEEKSNLESLYQQYRQIEKKIKALSGNERERAHKIDLLRFQLEEIDNAHLHPKEEEELSERKRCLVNGEKIRRYTTQSLCLLYQGQEESLSAVDGVSKALDYLQDLSNFDSQMQPVYEMVESAYVMLEDASRSLSRYAENLEFEPDELEQLEQRLNVLYGLKRKYGSSIDEILEYRNTIAKELDTITGSEQTVQILYQQKEKLKAQIETICMTISNLRRQTAKQIEVEIESHLHELEMKHARFKISITKKNDFTGNGWDFVEFLISANGGEELKPLAKIASGGEMSRVMLALKTVLSDVDTIETFVFDEIDTGVSGRTAQKVAEKMAFISKKRQILCITHLPQIAAMASEHFLIEKKSEPNKTSTSVQQLNRKGEIYEIARLMGGAKITDITLQAAEEMKLQAIDFRK